MTTGHSATSPPPAPRWWVADQGQTDGPFSQAYISACLAAGQYSSTTLLCIEGSQDWHPLNHWPQFGGYGQPVAPSFPSQPASTFAAPAGSASYSSYAKQLLPNKVRTGIVYARFVSPLIFFVFALSCIGFGPSSHADSPLRSIEEWGMVLGGGVDLLIRGVMFYGTLKIERRRREGAGLMALGAGLFAVWSILALVINIAFGAYISGIGHDLPLEDEEAALGLACILLPFYLSEIAYTIYLAFMLSDFSRKQPA